MADVSVLSEQLGRILRAAGWEVRSHRFTIRATEPAFEPIAHIWMAGAHRWLTDADVMEVKPSWIIVEDFTPELDIARLSSALERCGGGGRVTTYSRFVDDFWGATAAVQAAMLDAEMSDSDLLFGAEVRNTNDRHVVAHLDLGSLSVPDHRALDSGLPESGTCMAVLADAGLGKSELLRWHEWRYASLYNGARQSRKQIGLPPVALRVPLRDFKSLSLDYVAHNLSQPVPGGDRQSLPRITSGAVLRELIVQRRLILFLDGLDEVSADSTTVDAGIMEWRSVVRDGGHFVLTSREGHEASRGTIARRFSRDEIAYLKPLSKVSALELLSKRGSSDAIATQVIEALTPGPSAGIPLFLLLAEHVGLNSKPSPSISESKTLVFLRLLTLFCERDESRIGVSAEDQMNVLTEIAEWSMESGPLLQDELLKNLGVDPVDPLARIVRNPHALLTNNNGEIDFKFPEFGALFSARAIAQSWQQYGFNSIVGVLSARNLSGLVVEYLARLLLPEEISGAWVSSELQSEGTLMLRRNLLAVALARVADVAHSQVPNARATELAKVLGNRSIVNTSLSGLYLDRFDFADWQIRRVNGHGGTLNYCDNLWRTDRDESVATIDLVGCSFDPPQADDLDLTIGVDRLRLIVRPLRRKSGAAVVNLINRNEVTDVAAWNLLVKLKLAEASGKAHRARWTLTNDGVRLLTAFSIADIGGVEALDNLVGVDQDVRGLVQRLSKH